MRTARLVIFLLTSLTAWAVQSPSQGTLIIEGGSPSPEVVKRFTDLAGGPSAHVVVIPTASGDEILTPETTQKLSANLKKLFAVEDLVMLHTRDRKQADSEEFVAPLRRATGVWFPGGKAGQLLAPYVGTRTQSELQALLQRGGVIGGTSAGAMVMGSLMSYPGANVSPDWPKTGFGFVPGVTVGAHVIQEGMEDHLVSFVAEHPGVLALGPDVEAALVIKGDAAEVIGRSRVIIVDGKQHNGEPYLTLVPGERYDLKTRTATLLPPEARRAAENAPGMLHRGPAVSKQLEGDWRAEMQLPGVPAHYIFHFKNRTDRTVLATLEMGSGKSTKKFMLSDVRQEGLHLEVFLWGSIPDATIGARKAFFQGTISQDGSEITGNLPPLPASLTFKKIATPR
jgi:cyanophycinase